MNMTQQRFLLNRLDEAKRGKPSLYGSTMIPTPAVPSKVKQAKQQIELAKKVLADWDTACAKARKLVLDKVGSAFYEAKQAILFSASEDAIKAVERFEKMKF